MTIDEVKQKLKEMVDVDQAARNKENLDWKEIETIDRYNTQVLLDIIAEHGWPTIAKFGKEASNNAWLLAQHSDWTPDSQAYFLETILKLPEGEVKKGNIAYLTDRVMLKKEGKQRYGTQLIKEKGNNYYTLRPLEDKDNLDRLREEMEMIPISEYLGYSGWEKNGGAYIDEADYLEKTNKKINV